MFGSVPSGNRVFGRQCRGTHLGCLTQYRDSFPVCEGTVVLVFPGHSGNLHRLMAGEKEVSARNGLHVASTDASTVSRDSARKGRLIQSDFRASGRKRKRHAIHGKGVIPSPFHSAAWSAVSTRVTNHPRLAQAGRQVASASPAHPSCSRPPRPCRCPRGAWPCP